ncbi:TonB-dependent siderophore receptor [Alicycliphilus denitrificans]|uniref:TonB-dependent siderophore receptor n=1 Tax=Alicycliphilus denitrificans TaxID=179636 RepID=A0A3R7HQT0_9BURK|nr:TonB-dependent siderophore receptor [Alicycliphilus denitrificans]RKJ98815.1 TonB-dependent siderophore receptor [Alicycliphilus denitrificans]
MQRTTGFPFPLARGAIAAAALAALCLHAGAQTAAFDILAQPLPGALARFAQQSGVQIVYPPELVQGRRANAVQGAQPAEQALATLLRGSGLRMRRDGATLVIERIPAEDAAVLPEVRVLADAEAETATGPVHGLVARRSATATKTDTPLIETPQSITVVTAEQMRTLRTASVEQAFDYSAGVQAVSGYSRSFDAIYSRGFWIDSGGSQYADGLRLSGSSWASGKQEPYGLERVELIKGAASVLYGMAAPGGVLNTVSKRPTQERVREVVAEAGSHGHKQIGVDLGGAVSPEGDWDWRLTALVRDSGTPVGPLRNDGIYIAPALRWRPSADTSLTLLLQHQKREIGYPFALPVQGTLVPGPGGAFIPRFTFVGEPGFDRQDVSQTSLAALFEHRFSDDATLRSNLRLFDSKVDVFFTGAYNPVAGNPRLWERSAYDEFESAHGFASDTHWQQRWRSGAVEHTLLAGVDFMRLRAATDTFRRPIAPLDLYAPAYGAAVPSERSVAWLSREQRRQTGVYLQDQIKWGERWVLLAGLRHDRSSYTSGDARDAALKTEDTSALTGRMGLVYLLPGGWAPFAGYSQSFEPQGGTDAQGRRFDPTEGAQVEAGLRWQPPGRDFLLSASAFDLRKTNVLTPDPANPRFNVQTAEQRARGLEVEARGQASRDLELVGAYAYTDRRTTKSNVAEEVGRREARQPYHQASLWASYRLAVWDLPHWTVGAGLRYTGSTQDRNWRDGVLRGVPAYTLVDLMLAWQDGPWRVALNARNAFDKDYLVCGTGSCLHGDPRTVTLSAGYRW